MKATAAIVACVVSLQSTAAVAAPRASGALDSEVRSLRTTLERGGDAAAMEKAIDGFADRLVGSHITLAQIHDYVRARVSPREFREFRARLDLSLKGIDPATLKPEELTTVLLEGLGATRSDGLSWSGCIGLTWGVIGIVIALVVWFSSTVKVKSDAEIKASYELKRKNSNANYNGQIKRTLEWETSIPNSIRAEEREISDLKYRLQTIGSDISAAESKVRSAEYDLSRLDPESTMRSTYEQAVTDARAALDRLITELNDIPSDIRASENAIKSLQERFARYTANPDLAIQDAAALEVRRDQAIIDLNAREIAEIAEIPGELARQQANQRRNRTWAAVGGAIAGYFLVDGLIDTIQGDNQVCD